VHKLVVAHDGHETDLLATQKFAVIQRENGLESAMLDGALTATLQAVGVQVGDEIEFAASTRHHDPNLGDIAQGFAQLPIQDSQGRYRARFSWPAGMAMRWAATPDLPEPTRVKEGGEQILSYELADPQTVVTPDGAPPRYAIHRLHLPPAGAKWRWDYLSKPVNRSLAGTDYWRVASLENGVMHTLMSSRVFVPELSAAEAARVNILIPGFDNNMSMVYQVPAKFIVEPKPAVTAAQLGSETTGWPRRMPACAHRPGSAPRQTALMLAALARSASRATAAVWIAGALASTPKASAGSLL
jgi:hypothetical protein